jgi:hypothetical protein
VEAPLLGWRHLAPNPLAKRKPIVNSATIPKFPVRAGNFGMNGQWRGAEVPDVDDLRALLARTCICIHGAAQGDAKRRRWAYRTRHWPDTKPRCT